MEKNFRGVLQEMIGEEFPISPVTVTDHYKKEELIKVKEEQYDNINGRIRKNIQICNESLELYKALLTLNAEIQSIHSNVMNIAKNSHKFGPLEKEAIEIISKIKSTFN